MITMYHVESRGPGQFTAKRWSPRTLHRRFPTPTPHKGPQPSPQSSPQSNSMQFHVEKWESGRKYGRAIIHVRHGEHCALLSIMLSVPPQMDWWAKIAVINVQIHFPQRNSRKFLWGKLEPLVSNVPFQHLFMCAETWPRAQLRQTGRSSAYLIQPLWRTGVSGQRLDKTK